MSPDSPPNLVVPLGTRVVTRVEVRADTERAHRPVGSVAEIVGLPASALHRYRVRFADGGQGGLRRKLEQHVRSKGAIKWKHVMHMIRLLLSGTVLLREGELPVEVGAHRDRLLAIRDGSGSVSTVARRRPRTWPRESEKSPPWRSTTPTSTGPPAPTD